MADWPHIPGVRQGALIFPVEEVGGDGLERSGFWAELLEGGESFFGEARGFAAGALEAEDGWIGGFDGRDVFARGFPEFLGGLGHIENVIDDLEGESERLAKFGEIGELG
mgnify:CR=1 FL=1